MKQQDLGRGDRPGSPDAAGVLARAALFSGFPPGELGPIAALSGFVVLEEGRALFGAEDRGDRLYVVASGSVGISSPEDGSLLAEFVAGDSFGELEFLTGTSRGAVARAEGPTLLLEFPAGGADFRKALAGNPAVAARILRSFLLVVAGRTRSANALVKENSPWVRELKRQVYGDKLTGLLNRAWLEENLPKRLTAPLALLMLKPDNFKELNDRFGHEVGDAALVLMAGEFDRATSRDGTAVRWAGNELAVLYPGMDRPAALEAARAIQGRLSALDLSSLTHEPSLRLSISVGIALFPGHGTDAESLIAAVADLPLAARARGGSLILFPEDLS